MSDIEKYLKILEVPTETKMRMRIGKFVERYKQLVNDFTEINVYGVETARGVKILAELYVEETDCWVRTVLSDLKD
jgi:hypothetical protein